MNVSEKKLEILGQQVSKGEKPATYPSRLEEQRRLFLNRLDTIPRRSNTQRWVVYGTVTATAAAALVFVLFGLGVFTSTEIPFWIGEQHVAGTAGSWVEASEQSVSIAFDGGSLFQLQKGSAARVIEANAEHVIVDLSDGEIDCSVKGNGKTHWIVRAGTYQVKVTGTAFTVKWMPALANLSVMVKKGSVLVSGAPLHEHGVALSIGDRLEINTGEISITNVKRGATVSQFNEKNETAQDEHPESADSSVTSATARPLQLSVGPKNRQNKVRVSHGDGTAEWQKRFEEKDFAGAVAAAKAEGLDRLERQLSAEDLWKISKAARLIRDGQTAHKMLMAITIRYINTPKAQNATFLLGRVNDELLNNTGAAKQWYERYLSIAPNGALTEESLGRLVELCHRSGLHEKARSYAKTYLSQYPNGTFAERAESVLK